MLAYQTDGLLKSNLHRVKTPQPGAAGVSLRARYSLAFFANVSFILFLFYCLWFGWRVHGLLLLLLCYCIVGFDL